MYTLSDIFVHLCCHGLGAQRFLTGIRTWGVPPPMGLQLPHLLRPSSVTLKQAGFSRSLSSSLTCAQSLPRLALIHTLLCLRGRSPGTCSESALLPLAPGSQDRAWPSMVAHIPLIPELSRQVYVGLCEFKSRAVESRWTIARSIALVRRVSLHQLRCWTVPGLGMLTLPVLKLGQAQALPTDLYVRRYSGAQKSLDPDCGT